MAGHAKLTRKWKLGNTTGLSYNMQQNSGAIMPEESEEALILRFLKDDSKMSCANQVIFIRAQRLENYTQYFPRNVSALWVASYFGLCQIVRLLLNKGANIIINDDIGMKPIDLASSRGHSEVVQLLLKHTVDQPTNTALHQAAWNEHEAVVRILLQYGASIDAPDKIGMTALHLASQMGHEILIRFLLEKNADINLKTYHGRSAVCLAAQGGYSNVTELLLQHSEHLQYETESCGSALHIAFTKGHDHVVQIILEKFSE